LSPARYGRLEAAAMGETEEAVAAAAAEEAVGKAAGEEAMVVVRNSTNASIRESGRQGSTNGSHIW
jgi:hypothetical protein